MSAIDTLRNALFGSPPTVAYKPSREGVLKAFEMLSGQAAAAGVGLTAYETYADMVADTTQDEGTLAYVYYNNGSASDPQNGVYQFIGGWTEATWYIEQVAAVVQPLVDDAEGFADAAASAAGRAGPFVVPPLPASALYPIIDIEFYSEVDGVPVNIPANPTVYMSSRDSSNRGRFRVAGYTGPSTYTTFAIENEDNLLATFKSMAGLTGEIDWPLYAYSLSGIADRTVIGHIRFDADGLWGAYGATIPYSEGALYADKLRLSDYTSTEIATIAGQTVAERGALLFDDRSSYLLARQMFRSGAIGNGDKNDRYYFNLETIYFAGASLWRIRIFMHSTLTAAVVSEFQYQSSTNPTAALLAEKCIHMALMADGTHLPGDTGITGIFEVDWNAVDWTRTLTTFTDASATGLRPEIVVTTGEARFRFLAPDFDYAEIITYGATSGDFPTVVEAVQSVEMPDVVIARTTYPASNRCSPERPILFYCVDENHTERVLATTVLGVATSTLRLPHGSGIFTRHDTYIYMDEDVSSAPTVEANFTNRIEGTGVFVRDGATGGYVLHIDNANGISDPSPSDPKLLRRRIQTFIGQVTLRKSADNNVPLIGCGLSNGHDFVSDGTVYLMDANTTGAAAIFAHTSPDQTDPATMVFRNVSTNVSAPAPFLNLGKQHLTTVRHTVIIDNSPDITLVQTSNTTGDGLPGFILRGSKRTGLTTPADMNPY